LRASHPRAGARKLRLFSCPMSFGLAGLLLSASSSTRLQAQPGPGLVRGRPGAPDDMNHPGPVHRAGSELRLAGEQPHLRQDHHLTGPGPVAMPRSKLRALTVLKTSSRSNLALPPCWRRRWRSSKRRRAHSPGSLANPLWPSRACPTCLSPAWPI
jgi:hypothetical protein